MSARLSFLTSSIEFDSTILISEMMRDLNAAKEKLLDQVAIASEAAKQATLGAREKLTHGVETAGGYVNDQPFQSVAFAAGVDILIGMLIARNR